jgi:hypothetical protein
VARVAVWGAVVALMAACAEPDGRPVAARAATEVDRPRLPFESPLDVRFTFERSVEPAALEGPYRVFVHYTDPEGTLLWADDHEPPTPVAAWAPGEPVTWVRTSFLPRVPYVGPVEVRAGLFDPASGTRLRLYADVAGQDVYRLATF